MLIQKVQVCWIDRNDNDKLFLRIRVLDGHAKLEIQGYQSRDKYQVYIVNYTILIYQSFLELLRLGKECEIKTMKNFSGQLCFAND